MTGNGQQLTYLSAFISISIFYAFLQVAAEKKYSKTVQLEIYSALLIL